MRKKHCFRIVVVLAVLVTLLGCAAPTPFTRGKKAFKQGDYEKAAKEFGESIASGSDLFYSHLYIGRIHAIKKDYEKGIDECKKALDMAPKSPDAHTFLVVIYQLNDQHGEAERLWDKATNIPGLGKGFALKGIMPSPTKQKLRPHVVAAYMDILKGTVSEK